MSIKNLSPKSSIINCVVINYFFDCFSIYICILTWVILNNVLDEVKHYNILQRESFNSYCIDE